MTAYINVKTGQYPVNEGDIRLAFPNVSFPVAFVPPEDYAPVQEQPQPSVTDAQTLSEGAPQNIDGGWVQTWVVSPASPEQIAERQAAALARRDSNRRQAYQAESDPLFFMAQRGETTQQAWLDKVAEIKARFP